MHSFRMDISSTVVNGLSSLGAISNFIFRGLLLCCLTFAVASCGSDDEESSLSAAPPTLQEGWTATLLAFERSACVDAVVENSVQPQTYCICVFEEISTTYSYSHYNANVIAVLDDLVEQGVIASCVQLARID